MQDIQIKISEVLDHVYAISALGTLFPNCKISILHPDHADALRIVLRDSLAAVLSAAPSGSLTLKGVSDDAYTLCIKDGINSLAAAEAVRNALCCYTLGIVCGAAGLPVPPLPSLDCLAPTTVTGKLRVRPFI